MYNDPILLAQIKHDEGRSAVVYKDSRGFWTIGDGILVDFRIPSAGLRPEEMDFITLNRVSLAATDAMNLVGAQVWGRLNDARRRVLINMTYNLGGPDLAKFHRMLQAIIAGDWATASTEMQTSLWYKQVGDRGVRLAHTMLTGEEPH